MDIIFFIHTRRRILMVQALANHQPTLSDLVRRLGTFSGISKHTR